MNPRMLGVAAVVITSACGSELTSELPPCASAYALGTELADDAPSAVGPSGLDLVALVDGITIDAVFSPDNPEVDGTDPFASAITVLAEIDGPALEYELEPSPDPELAGDLACPGGPMLRVPIWLEVTVDGLGATTSGAGEIFAMGDAAELTWVHTNALMLDGVPGWLQDLGEAYSCAGDRLAETTLGLTFSGTYVGDGYASSDWALPNGSLGTWAKGDEVNCAGAFFRWSEASETTQPSTGSSSTAEGT